MKKKERSEINNLSFYFKTPDKEEQIKFKARRRKEITKIKAEISKIRNINNRENQCNQNPGL